MEGEEEKTDCISVFSGYDTDRGCKKKWEMSQGSDFQDGEKDIEEAERNLPQIVMHILQRAFFKHALEKEKKSKVFSHISRALLGVRI